jgi:hypothetical protein
LVTIAKNDSNATATRDVQRIKSLSEIVKRDAQFRSRIGLSDCVLNGAEFQELDLRDAALGYCNRNKLFWCVGE